MNASAKAGSAAAVDEIDKIRGRQAFPMSPPAGISPIRQMKLTDMAKAEADHARTIVIETAELAKLNTGRIINIPAPRMPDSAYEIEGRLLL